LQRIAALKVDGEFHRERTNSHARRDCELLCDADQGGRPANAVRLYVGVGNGIDAGELQRAEESANKKQEHHHLDWRRRRKSGAYRQKSGADDGIDDQDIAEAEAAQNVRCRPLHSHGAERGCEGDHSGLERRHAEADLKHQGQKER